jgi:hypothetical protein
MANVGITLAAVAAILIGCGGQTLGDEFDPGKSEYQPSCATWHGKDGKGNGPVGAELKVPPPDLTVLAKKNNGVFPFNSVYELIDGAENGDSSRHARYADLGHSESLTSAPTQQPPPVSERAWVSWCSLLWAFQQERRRLLPPRPPTICIQTRD